MKHYNTRLLVSDFKTSFVFYRDVLGLAPKFGDESDVYAEFETGGAALALFRRDLMAYAIGASVPAAVAAGPDRVVLTFAVENVWVSAGDLSRHAKMKSRGQYTQH